MDALKDLESRIATDPEFRRQWVEDSADRDILFAIAELRCGQGLSQKELAERTGIRQGDISKIESGKGNPTLATLNKIAIGLGMRLEIKFVQY